MKLEPTITVHLGEEEMTLSEALQRAASMEGVTHVSVEPASFPKRLATVAVLSGEALMERLGRMVHWQDLTMILEVDSGAQTGLYEMKYPRAERQPS